MLFEERGGLRSRDVDSLIADTAQTPPACASDREANANGARGAVPNPLRVQESAAFGTPAHWPFVSLSRNPLGRIPFFT